MRPSLRQLDNGVRVLVVPMKGNPTVTVQVMVRTGSYNETPKTNGISHFLEHVCFKGTTRRPSVFAISSELDSLGAYYNAFTSTEMTAYYAKGEAHKLPELFDVISDIYLDPIFPQEEIIRERGVVIEEINMYNDKPRSVLSDNFARLVHGSQAPGRTVLGPIENISRFTHADCARYHRAQYTADNTLVVVAGGVEARAVTKLAKAAFANLAAGTPRPAPVTNVAQRRPKTLAITKSTDQTHLSLGFRSLPRGHVDQPVLRVLATILSGGMSSRLFMKLREQMGAAYYVTAYQDSATHHGMFEIDAGVDRKRVDEVIAVLLSECARLKTEPVDRNELKRAQDILAGNLVLGLESSDALAFYFGSQELFLGELTTPATRLRQYRRVTPADITRLATQIFTPANLNLAVLGRGKKINLDASLLR